MSGTLYGDAFPARTTEPETVLVPFSFVGVTSSVAKVFGANMAVARTGTGTYTLTPSAPPGEFLTWVPSLTATTASGLAGFSAVGTWAAGVLTIVVYNASQAATDLAAAQWLGGMLVFASAENAS